MSTVAPIHLAGKPALRDEERAPANARLLSIATAVPAQFQAQEQIAATLARLWNLRGAELKRWERIIAGSEIAQRHGVLSPEEVVHLSTAQRMRVYEQRASELALGAARDALAKASVASDEVTDLIVVTCTGFSAPGVDIALVDRLNLGHDVRRLVVGFMGCFGAITGLRAAMNVCGADADAVVLLVAVELCSLHVRADRDPQNQVAAALFADGAAAAVVGRREAHRQIHGANEGGIGHLSLGASLLLPEGREWMSWRITDAGFAMTLTRDVPAALRERLRAFVENGAVKPASCIVHPGGPGVLDAVDEALGLRGGGGIDAAREVLRRYGNMSSPTVLFVLEEARQRGCEMPALLLAFGPGLTIESAVVGG